MKLIRAEVEGLLGRFKHTVKFAPDQEFVILYGPNGIGKTRLLELINATFNGRLLEIMQTPFDSLTLTFEDRSSLTLAREGQRALFDSDIENSVQDLSVTLSPASGSQVKWSMGKVRSSGAPISRALRLIESDVPVNRIAINEWHDIAHGDVLSRDQLLDRYGSLLPPEVRPYQLPDEIQSFLENLESHLIETQRLLREPPRTKTTRGVDKASKATVEAFSQNFSQQMSDVLAQNSRTSQERDRTFPRKLLSSGEAPTEATEDAIRARYAQQSELRARLAEIALLEQSSTDLPLPNRELKDWERLVLWTYLDDSEDKLANLLNFLERAELFMKIMNSRLEYKKLKLSREGFEVRSDFGQSIPVSSLSSGEQHELVLTYELLFNVNRGALVLIDEPEISLHVAWQQEFMNDLANISKTASLRFIVATHSPQIIHKWWSRAEQLSASTEESK
ncbi:AAA family ATPase [Streptomyces sp. NPDC048211]|uniref:AAA family ATPase n=1 Tax=Streptomyces sp. NPDC048211 TaxID=3365516 RepID=UPI0037180011